PTPAPPRLSGGFGRQQETPVTPAQRGQSMADVVRAASETRLAKETPRPGIAITNGTLVTDPNRGRLTTWQPTPTPRGGSPARLAPSARPTAAAEAAPAPAAAGAGAPSEEARWQEIARRARQRVADARDSVSRLEAESKKLENDFYSWDDGLYRDNVIKPAWDKKREELETARRELEDAERDLADLPEKARKAGALPGWIRE
ncbi:MAG TPA: hypothetical protein VEG84_03315, partial [Thermoanaerobaculia bacterium]|nr:hypothetical protein [Thermoanaerobaculia bacterium]